MAEWLASRSRLEEQRRRWMTGEIDTYHPDYVAAIEWEAALDRTATRGEQIAERRRAASEAVKAKRDEAVAREQGDALVEALSGVCRNGCEHAIAVGMPEYAAVRPGGCGNCAHYND